MNTEQRISAFSKLGERLESLISRQELPVFNGEKKSAENFSEVVNRAHLNNAWFIKENILMAMHGISEMLKKEELERWVVNYSSLKSENTLPKRVGVIMAGNIPMVGFHDLLCVLISGNILVAKCSSDDKILLPYLSELLCEIEPRFKDRIIFVDKLKDIDAVIATGSNNSARYFEYYFSKYPHVIRKNRNAVAVLTGNETGDDLKNLGHDIFSYFGLGCRNVSKLYVPQGHNFNLFFESIESFSSAMMNHNKYMNNYDYNRSIFLLQQIPFLTNNFLIIKEDAAIATPVSVLNYEFYDDKNKLKEDLISAKEKIQCVVSKEKITGGEIDLGQAQYPKVDDYADGVDTMMFLGCL